MNGITFGDYHSSNDLKLLLTHKEMGSPAVKTNKVDIPGADSSSDFMTQFSTIKNAIHGKKVRIILDDDPTFFYWGRCYVSSFTSAKGVGTISVECECEPYKYKLTKTVVTKTVSGTADITLTNSRKRAVPEITTTASMTFVFGNGSWAKGAGTFTIPELELVEGNNRVTVTGTGTVSFSWTEGDL